MNDPLVELVERVTALTGPDREIDAMLFAAFPDPDRVDLATVKKMRAGSEGDGTVLYTRTDEGGSFFIAAVPAYTASIEAALALMERMLPESRCWFAARQADETGEYSIDLRHGNGTGKLATASHKTFPLAIILALLRALSSQEASK